MKKPREYFVVIKYMNGIPWRTVLCKSAGAAKGIKTRFENYTKNTARWKAKIVPLAVLESIAYDKPEIPNLHFIHTGRIQ